MPNSINTSSSRWFIRGWLLGALACGTANAASYFFHSQGWSQLWRPRIGNMPPEALGFPWKVWEAGNSYGGYFVNYPMLIANAAVAALCCLCVGAVVWSQRARLNQLVARWEAEQPAQSSATAKLQFSMRTMLLWTIVAALVCGMLRGLFVSNTATALVGDRGETLLAIMYLLGPWLLVAAALSPRGLAWQHRVGLIIPLTMGLIAFAIGVGSVVGLTLENVLLGIVVCWTPQAMFAAFVLTVAFLLSQYVKHRPPANRLDETSPEST